MPPFHQKYPKGSTETTLAKILQITPSQAAARSSLPSQSATDPKENSITSEILIAVVISCGLVALVFLSCCFGCWKPFLDQWRFRKALRDHPGLSEESGRTCTNTDGTALETTSHERTLDSDTDSYYNYAIDDIIARHVFRGREHKAHREEIKLRRLVQAEGNLRSSQGLTLPVHFRKLKGKVKVLSRSLVGTEVAAASEMSEYSESQSSVHPRQTRFETGDVCPTNANISIPARESKAPLDITTSCNSLKADQSDMSHTLSDHAQISNTLRSDFLLAGKTPLPAYSEGELFTKLDKA